VASGEWPIWRSPRWSACTSQPWRSIILGRCRPLWFSSRSWSAWRRAVEEAADGAEAVRLVARLPPDVVLMDVRMPQGDGLEATRRIVAAGSPSRVIVLTTYDDEAIHAALRAGASGFMLKDVRPAEWPTRSG
jgi:DNA-binding NarL/FixJ family response regulator